MTDRLAEIRARWSNLTPGDNPDPTPWLTDGFGQRFAEHPGNLGGAAVAWAPRPEYDHTVSPSAERTFQAHAYEDIEFLYDQLTKVKAERDEFARMFKECHSEHFRLLKEKRAIEQERDEARALVTPALEQGMEAVRQKQAAEAKLAQVWKEGFKADPTGSYDGNIEEFGGNPYLTPQKNASSEGTE